MYGIYFEIRKKKKAKEKIFGYKQVGEILDIIESGLWSSLYYFIYFAVFNNIYNE